MLYFYVIIWSALWCTGSGSRMHRRRCACCPLVHTGVCRYPSLQWMKLKGTGVFGRHRSMLTYQKMSRLPSWHTGRPDNPQRHSRISWETVRSMGSCGRQRLFPNPRQSRFRLDSQCIACAWWNLFFPSPKKRKTKQSQVSRENEPAKSFCAEWAYGAKKKKIQSHLPHKLKVEIAQDGKEI